MGMIGGGRGAFIGAVHRMAAGIDGEIELVCGAFHSDPEIAVLSGGDLHLEKGRAYRSYHEMFDKESQLSGDKRMDFVSIVTPNHVHFEPARLALENGFHVVLREAYGLLFG
jgi:predicted dehydrogenase